jgi:uncharacterized protein YqgC (DUF456 family)
VKEILLTVLAGVLMLIGLVGVFLPILPEMFLIWLASLGYGLLVGWGQSGPWAFGVITVLGVLGTASEIWVTGAGAKMGGGSLWSALAGLALGAIGLMIFPPFGALVGLLLGAFLVELYRQRGARKALKAMFGIGLGYGASFVIKLILALIMIATWLVWVVVR